jgi:anti-sigma B factor antagonist
VTDFTIATDRVGDTADLVVTGELDMYTAPRLREQLVELATVGVRQVIVDLAGVRFIDSTALGVLVGGLKRLRQSDGELVLRGPRPGALRVLELTGLTRVFTVIPGVVTPGRPPARPPD